MLFQNDVVHIPGLVGDFEYDVWKSHEEIEGVEQASICPVKRHSYEYVNNWWRFWGQYVGA